MYLIKKIMTVIILVVKANNINNEFKILITKDKSLATIFISLINVLHTLRKINFES